MRPTAWLETAAVLALVGCAGAHERNAPAPISPSPEAPASPPPPAAPTAPSCSHGGAPLRVHVYDVGQALAALVDLPDGRHVLVDTGDSPARPECDACGAKNRHLLERLRADLRGAPLDLVWITHPHSDHVGGAPEVLASVPVRLYVDNGRDLTKPEVRRARAAALAHGASVRVVDPEHGESPLPSSADVTLTAIVPAAWPASCARDANECSIGLRIDSCASSILFTGDTEDDEEKALDPRGPVTLLQVGHHGSETSTSPAFLARVKPRYAVLSSGKPDEGVNRDYCHPRAVVVRRLTRVIGESAGAPLRAFDGDRCDRAKPSDWIDVPTSSHLWATARDGDVTLVTTGDGVFTRE